MVRDWYTWTGTALMNPGDSQIQVELGKGCALDILLKSSGI